MRNPTASGLAAIINHLLSRADWARERLAPHAEETFVVQAAPFTVGFSIDTRGMLHALEQASERGPDVRITVPPERLPELLSQTFDERGTALTNIVRLEGNAELADALGFVFRNLEWDAEDDLSRIMGDIPAHRLTRLARALRAAHARALSSLTGNMVEYLTEEAPMLVNRHALACFSDDVRALRDTLSRLEKRIERASRQLPRKP